METDRPLVLARLSSNDPAALFDPSNGEPVSFPADSTIDLEFHPPIRSSDIDEMRLRALDMRVIGRIQLCRLSPEGDELDVFESVWRDSGVDCAWSSQTINAGEWTAHHFRLRHLPWAAPPGIRLIRIELLASGKLLELAGCVRVRPSFFTLERFHCWPPVAPRIMTASDRHPSLTVRFCHHKLLAVGVTFDAHPDQLLELSVDGEETVIGVIERRGREGGLYRPITYKMAENARYYSEFKLSLPSRGDELLVLGFPQFDLYGHMVACRD
jgi:hypothetical protein